MISLNFLEIKISLNYIQNNFDAYDNLMLLVYFFLLQLLDVFFDYFVNLISRDVSGT